MMKSEPPVTGGNQEQEIGYLANVLWSERESQRWTLEALPSTKRMYVPSWEGAKEKRQLVALSLTLPTGALKTA